jgi:hypothetical protein
VIDHAPKLIGLGYVGLVIFGIIVALSIVYEGLKYLKIHVIGRSSGANALNIMMKLVFFLPCLFLEVVNWIHHELAITSGPVWTALFVEILVMLVLIYYPWLLQKITRHEDGQSVVNEPLYLNVKQVRGSILAHIPKVVSSSSTAAAASESSSTSAAKRLVSSADLAATETGYPRNYAITAWVFINPQSSSHLGYVQKSNILRLGPADKKYGSPMLTYFNEPTHGIGTYRVYYSATASNNNDKYLDFRIPVSKWTFFVFNYSQTFDVFIDTELVASVSLADAGPNLDDNFQFVVGDDNGLDGAICNMVYTPYPISKQNMNAQYLVLKNSNPPVPHIKQ